MLGLGSGGGGGSGGGYHVVVVIRLTLPVHAGRSGPDVRGPMEVLVALEVLLEEACEGAESVLLVLELL